MRHFIYFTIFTLLSGCASQPTNVTPVVPVQIDSPAPGSALVYLFRPALDKTGSRAVPHLYVNGTRLTQLPASSYVAVSISAGAHTFELRPSDSFEGAWATAFRFCAEAGKVYFAAVWNQAQPLSPGFTAIRLPSGVFIPIPLGPTSQRGKVVFEPVSTDLGQESLAGLSVVKVDPASPASIPAQAPKCPAA